MIWTTLLNVIYLAVIALSFYMAGWLLLKADRNQVTSSLAACQILMMLWCIPQLFLALPMSCLLYTSRSLREFTISSPYGRSGLRSGR